MYIYTMITTSLIACTCGASIYIFYRISVGFKQSFLDRKLYLSCKEINILFIGIIMLFSVQYSVQFSVQHAELAVSSRIFYLKNTKAYDGYIYTFSPSQHFVVPH